MNSKIRLTRKFTHLAHFVRFDQNQILGLGARDTKITQLSSENFGKVSEKDHSGHQHLLERAGPAKETRQVLR